MSTPGASLPPPTAAAPRGMPPPQAQPPLQTLPPQGGPPMGGPPQGFRPMGMAPPPGAPPTTAVPPGPAVGAAAGGLPPAAPAQPPVAALAGLKIEGARSKAGVQRRVYAPGEVDAQAPGGLQQPTGSVAPPSQYHSSEGAARGGSGRQSAGSPSNNRIDPSQIPRPEAAQKPAAFATRTSIGECPPPATSAYEVTDDGNCSPRYMRLTLNHVPTQSDMLTSSAIPFGVVAQPLVEVPAEMRPLAPPRPPAAAPAGRRRL